MEHNFDFLKLFILDREDNFQKCFFSRVVYISKLETSVTY